MPRTTTIASAGVGALLGAATARAGSRLLGERTAYVAAGTLVPMAAIYPAARHSFRDGPAVAREAVGVLAMAGFTAAALRGPVRTLAALGWLSHSLFDATHDLGDGSRLPDWYRPLCAGFDVAVAGVLALDAR